MNATKQDPRARKPEPAADPAYVLSSWLNVEPRVFSGVPREPIEALVTLLDAFGLAGTMTSDLRARVEDLASKVQNLELIARVDHNTGIGNRRAVEERLHAEWTQATRHGRPLSVVTLDVDMLKQTNDGHGHQAGDALLKAVASRLAGAVRGGDFVGRTGGDEFVVVCPDTDHESAALVARKLVRAACCEPVDAEGTLVPVSISAGWATSENDSTAADLLRRADTALYASKRSGRGRTSGPAV